MTEVQAELLKLLTNPHVLKSTETFMRVDLTLKQRRETELPTRRPATHPRILSAKPTRQFTFVPAADAAVPVTSVRIRNVDYDGTLDRPGVVNVRPKAFGKRPISLQRAALLATEYYLTSEEARKIAVRIVNHLNVHFFRGRARRKRNPMKLPALVCLHDRGTRQHLHMLFGLPLGVTSADFKQALRHVFAKEPFVFDGAVDDERSCRIAEVKSVAASVIYNADDHKSLADASVLYSFPNSPEGEPRNEANAETRHVVEHRQCSC